MLTLGSLFDGIGGFPLAAVNNAGSVLVITNSAFLLNWRKK